jgi:hypothetical protein
VAIVAIDWGRIDRRSAAGRALSLALMAVLVASAAVAASRLVVDLVEGGPETIRRRICSRPASWSGSAFSPTDVMPLARWAKLAMTVQAVSSLMILGLVIARAVNILH